MRTLLREINQQITKLESQAETASKYNKHQENLKFQEAQVWALKKRDANESWDQIKTLITNQQTELDQFTTALRDIEVNVENAGKSTLTHLTKLILRRLNFMR